MYQWYCSKSTPFLGTISWHVWICKGWTNQQWPSFYQIFIYIGIPLLHYLGRSQFFMVTDAFCFSWIFYYSSEFLMDCSKLLGYLPDGLFVITSMSYCD